MAIGGGSAGSSLAMLYAYRDGAASPVPVKLLFEAVGPSCFYAEDWKRYGPDHSPEAAAAFFSVMSGSLITPKEIQGGSYLEKVRSISAIDWIRPDSCPSIVAYGRKDIIQPYDDALRLKAALEENQVDFQFFTAPHSGHGLQNDSNIYRAYMEAVRDGLRRYLPL